jgi:thiamine biosynthesis lipoprotein
MFVVRAAGKEADGSDGSVSDDTSDDSIDDWQVVQTPAMEALRADKKP